MSLSGILKRKKPNPVFDEKDASLISLNVFGYSATIYHDDMKALEIENSLIPWNGNNNLKIDRFDVRCQVLSEKELHDLEAPKGGFDNRLNYLTKEEQLGEQLAEEERYYSLYHNEIEEKMYEEEEQKRMQRSYGQFNYSYSENSTHQEIVNKNNDVNEESQETEEIIPFSPPENLEIPSNIVLPDTMKQHAIIEKTGKFISEQGQQMEILIKAKQSNNPQFEFLNLNNRLNPYYKFILDAFKNKKYSIIEKPVVEMQSKIFDNDTSSNEPSNIEVVDEVIEYKIFTPKFIPHKDCTYTQLISKIKGVPLPLIPSNCSNAQVGNNIIDNNKQIVRQDNEYSNNNHPKPEVKKLSSGLALTLEYASDSDSEEDDTTNDAENNDSSNNDKFSGNVENFNFPIPPEPIRNIIEKTATYVQKNGKQFEETLKLKGDDRFLFLYDDNEFNPYYYYKVSGKIPIKNAQRDNKKFIAPVSFSIKKEEPSKSTTISKPALQSSDDEAIKPNLPEKVIKAIQMVENQLVAKSARLNAENSKTRFDVDCTGSIVKPPSQKLEIQKELRRAEEKVKDRLAQIAREKLGLISKEKQLQLERKKKAVAFLSQIKANEAPSSSSTSDKRNKNYESDNDSIHSIPISSYGDVEEEEEIRELLSSSESLSKDRSRSKSPKYHHKSKRSKSKHSKSKKSKKRSRSPHSSERKIRSSSKKSKNKKYERD